MSITVVRYKTKPERGDENAAFIEKVFAELNADRPAGVRYASLRLDDGVSFIHLAITDDPNPLFNVSAFTEFTKDIADRCAEPPVTAKADVVGSFGLFAEGV